jgi:hypothetical protein
MLNSRAARSRSGHGEADLSQRSLVVRQGGLSPVRLARASAKTKSAGDALQIYVQSVVGE